MARLKFMNRIPWSRLEDRPHWVVIDDRVLQNVEISRVQEWYPELQSSQYMVSSVVGIQDQEEGPRSSGISWIAWRAISGLLLSPTKISTWMRRDLAALGVDIERNHLACHSPGDRSFGEEKS